MLIEIKYRSPAIRKETAINVIIPSNFGCESVDHKVLWLLHGLGANHTVWMRQSSIERYANDHNLVVIMPDVNRSWYTDTAYGEKYFTYITEELPKVIYSNIKGLRTDREHNLVAGNSMGGYGAVKLALTYPERFGACISLSGSLDIARRGRACDLPLWRAIFGFDLQEPTELLGTDCDLFTLAEKVRESGAEFPDIFMWCGTEDTEILKTNLLFDEHLKSLGVPHEFRTSEGDHTWKWWDMHIQTALEYVLGK